MLKQVSRATGTAATGRQPAEVLGGSGGASEVVRAAENNISTNNSSIRRWQTFSPAVATEENFDYKVLIEKFNTFVMNGQRFLLGETLLS